MDAIELLTEDHQEVERLFGQLGQDDFDQHEVLSQIVRQLSMHDAVERRIFYPDVEQNVPGGRRLTERAVTQHDEIDRLLASVDGSDPSDPEVARQVGLLVNAVRSHVKEEETEIFPAVVQASETGELLRLGARLESAKAWAPTHPHPHAKGSGPLTAPFMAAASVMDMARDNMAQSKDTETVEAIKGEDKAPLADPDAGDRPPVDMLTWPEVHRDEGAREDRPAPDEVAAEPAEAESASDEPVGGPDEQADARASAPAGRAAKVEPSASGPVSPPEAASTPATSTPAAGGAAPGSPTTTRLRTSRRATAGMTGGAAAEETPAPSAADAGARSPGAATKPAPTVTATKPDTTTPDVATTRPAPSEASVAELVGQLAEQASLLARQELALTRLELKATGRRAGLGLGALSLAGAIGLLGGAALVAGVVLLVAHHLAAWVAALVVGGGLSLLAGLIALMGGLVVRRAVRPPAVSTLDQVRTDLDVVRDSASAPSGEA